MRCRWLTLSGVSLLLGVAMLVAGAALAEELRAIPPAQADNEVTRLLERLDVLPPEHYRGLTVFPLELRAGGEGTDCATLGEAIRAGYLRVWDTGRYEGVTMENLSAGEWVLAVAGEVIYGGRQNRMVSEDVLLPPGGGPILVPAYCVERGRWTGRSDRFEGSHCLPSYGLRSKALAGAPQAEVWAQVESEQRRFGVQSPTGDYGAVAESPAVAHELAGYRSAFAPVWRGRAAGFVVAQGGRIVAADAFSSPRLFWRLRDRLVDSYAYDCVRRFPEGRGWGLRQVDARDFMARLYSARYSVRGTPGAGETLAFGGNGVSGASLIYRGDVMHLHVTPGQVIRPMPVPEPGPLPIPRGPIEEKR